MQFNRVISQAQHSVISFIKSSASTRGLRAGRVSLAAQSAEFKDWATDNAPAMDVTPILNLLAGVKARSCSEFLASLDAADCAIAMLTLADVVAPSVSDVVASLSTEYQGHKAAAPANSGSYAVNVDADRGFMALQSLISPWDQFQVWDGPNGTRSISPRPLSVVGYSETPRSGGARSAVFRRMSDVIDYWIAQWPHREDLRVARSVLVGGADPNLCAWVIGDHGVIPVLPDSLAHITATPPRVVFTCFGCLDQAVWQAGGRWRFGDGVRISRPVANLAEAIGALIWANANAPRV